MKNSKIIVGVVIGIVISITLSFCLAETLIESKNVSYVDNSKLGATNVQNAIDGTCTKFSNDLINLKKQIINEIYPVGSIYISTELSTVEQVQNKFGGTWETYGTDKVLRGTTSKSGTTGGANTVTLTTANLPAHTHNYDKANANTGSHTLTIAEMPSHPGHVERYGGEENYLYLSKTIAKQAEPQYYAKRGWVVYEGNELYPASTNYGGGGGHTHPISTTSTATSSAGSTNPTAINVQDPYVTVFMYRRKA